MDAEWIITAFLVIDHTMEQLGHRSDVRAQAPDSDVITVAVVAANYVQNHHERASRVMRQLRSLSGSLHRSRCNRRLHRLADWVAVLATVLGELFARGDVVIIDRMPVPVCRRARAALSQRARAGVVRLLRSQRRAVVWLALASDRHAKRRAGQLPAPAGSVSRPDAAPRGGLRPAARGAAHRRHGLRQRRRCRQPAGRHRRSARRGSSQEYASAARARRAGHPNLSSRDGDGSPSR